jgi:hypothetical protein
VPDVTSDGEGVRSSRGGRAPKTQAGSASGLGPALNLTDEQLEHAATVTPFDTAAADALWRANVTPKLADLLNAEPEA